MEIIVVGLVALLALALLRMAQAWDEYLFAVRRAELRTRMQRIQESEHENRRNEGTRV